MRNRRMDKGFEEERKLLVLKIIDLSS